MYSFCLPNHRVRVPLNSIICQLIFAKVDQMLIQHVLLRRQSDHNPSRYGGNAPGHRQAAPNALDAVAQLYGIIDY